MGSPSIKELKRLQKILSEKNIYKLRDRFLEEFGVDGKSSFVLPNEFAYDIDFEKGVIENYCSEKDNIIVTNSFENKLRDILYEATIDVHNEIDSSFLMLPNVKKFGYFKEISRLLDSIKTDNQRIFELFPICNKPIDSIKEYLKSKYNYEPISFFNVEGHFNLKDEYTIDDIEVIYVFLTRNSFIDYDIYSFEEFSSVFNDIETNITIAFNCETPIIVCILVQLKRLFDGFTAKKIEESGRFFTKTSLKKKSHPITENMYYASRNRYKKPVIIEKIEIIEKFFSEKYP